jgi:hypothetical protein
MGSAAAVSGALDYQREVTSEPLRPDEIKLLHRLLSDPSVLPRDFKQWVTDHASDSVDIAKSQVHGLVNSSGSLIFTAASWEQLGIALCPMIVPYPASKVPAVTWTFCDGTMLLESEYKALYGYIGHAHDNVVSSGQFGVPDLRGRAIYGYDPQGTAYQILLGDHDDAAPGGRGPWHHHVVPNVTTGVNVGTQLASGSTYPRFSPQGLDYPTSGAPPLDGGAWYGLNYIIANGKIP